MYSKLINEMTQLHNVFHLRLYGIKTCTSTSPPSNDVAVKVYVFVQLPLVAIVKRIYVINFPWLPLSNANILSTSLGCHCQTHIYYQLHLVAIVKRIYIINFTWLPLSNAYILSTSVGCHCQTHIYYRGKFVG